MTSQSRRRRAGAAGAGLALLLAPLLPALPARASASAAEIVYASDADGDGVYGIALRDVRTGRTTTVLPADRTRQWLYDDPELSPRGDRVALSSDRGAPRYDEGIAVVGRDGRGFRRVTEPPAAVGTTYTIDIGPAWSPDGATLLFTRITTNTADATAIRASTALWTVPAAGGAARQVPGTEGGYLGDWSPDGRSVVFSALAPDADSGPLTVVGLDGSGRRTLPGAVGLMPAWSPDGATIAYATITARDADRTRARDVAQIATVPAAGGPVTVLARSRPTSAPTVAGHPGWSPDGESLLFDLFGPSDRDSSPPGDLWTVDRTGARAGRVVATRGDEAQGSAQGPAATRVGAGPASTFTPVTPRRVLDTRTGTGGRRTRLGAGATTDLVLRGVRTTQGVVPASASAVVLGVTAVDGTAGTDLRASPSRGAVPAGAAVVAPARTTVRSLVTVRLGANGAVTLRNAAGSVHALVDLVGWYAPDAGGLGVATVDPARVLDTRSPAVGVRAGRVGPRGTVDLAVVGAVRTADGPVVTVPADARAVVLSLTGMAATATTDVRAYPTPAGGAAVPPTTDLHLRPGQSASTLVTVAVGAGGRVRLRNTSGSVHLAADVAGWYAPSAPGRFVPVDAARFLDTRSGTGAARLPTGAGGVVDLRVAGTRGVPAGATAAVLTLTGTGATGTTDVRASPRGAARVPRTSSLQLVRGQTRAGAVLVRVGTDGRVRLRNSAGQVELLADLTGYVVG